MELVLISFRSVFLLSFCLNKIHDFIALQCLFLLNEFMTADINTQRKKRVLYLGVPSWRINENAFIFCTGAYETTKSTDYEFHFTLRCKVNTRFSIFRI